MNKKDVTEAAIKIVAIYMILQSIVRTMLGTLDCVLDGDASLPTLVFPLGTALVVVVFWMIVVRKADWILSKLYKE